MALEEDGHGDVERVNLTLARDGERLVLSFAPRRDGIPAFFCGQTLAVSYPRDTPLDTPQKQSIARLLLDAMERVRQQLAGGHTG